MLQTEDLTCPAIPSASPWQYGRSQHVAGLLRSHSVHDVHAQMLSEKDAQTNRSAPVNAPEAYLSPTRHAVEIRKFKVLVLL